MKTYGRKFVQRAMFRNARRHLETRDGVLWTIDTENKVCRIKIQGSNELIVAHYPRNKKIRPDWLRIGAAVRIVHREGNRGYIEVVGEGRAIPTPVSGDALPDTGGTADGIISGLVARATDPATNHVEVTSGTYRIDNMIYSYTGLAGIAITMADPAPMTMGEVPVYTMGLSTVSMDAAPTQGLFRYDSLFLGTDGTIDYAKGAEVASDPVKPSTPADHILVRHILRTGGATVIENAWIGVDWTTPKATTMTVVVDTATWSLITSYPEYDIEVSAIDQYGNAIQGSSGWLYTLTKIVGTGDLWSGDVGYDDDEVTQSVLASDSYTFKYRRDQTESPELLPILNIAIAAGPSILSTVSVNLLDINGDPLYVT